jgi:hypothetical protein
LVRQLLSWPNLPVMITTHAVAIPKEQVAQLTFPREAVQLSDEHRQRRDRKIQRAMQLGNAEHGKCRILFKDAEGLKVVETTVWSFDKDNIVLKYGLTIPVARVLDIEMP